MFREFKPKGLFFLPLNKLQLIKTSTNKGVASSEYIRCDHLIMNDEQKAIYDELVAHYDQVNEKALHRKKAKKNGLTTEGLHKTALSGFDDLIKYEPDWQTFSLPKFRKKLDWYMKRAVNYYMNEALTYTVARKFGNLNLPLEEREAATRAGFVIALNNFDESKGFQFSTFAWTIMSNEIKAAYKRRQKAMVVKQKPRDILATNDGFIFQIAQSRNSRKIMFQGERIIPDDVFVYENNGNSEKVYEYLYDLSPEIKEGASIKKGQRLGKTAGVETEVASVDKIMDDAVDRYDPVFSNPLNNESDNDPLPDSLLEKSIVNADLQKAVKSLSKQEQLIITQRFLMPKKTNRSTVARSMQTTEYQITKIEKSALAKLKDVLLENGIDTSLN